MLIFGFLKIKPFVCFIMMMILVQIAYQLTFGGPGGPFNGVKAAAFTYAAGARLQLRRRPRGHQSLSVRGGAPRSATRASTPRPDAVENDQGRTARSQNGDPRPY